ncbi:MAG TPA: phosphatase PAP2 family protein [Candidatus Binatus sp.]|nr:phosphatase PAP2 family protein [Candidatus Binatus sp.]
MGEIELYKGGNTESVATASDYSKAAPQTARDRPRGDARVSRSFLDDPDYVLRAWGAILLLCAVDWIWATHAGLRFGELAAAIKGVVVFAAIGFLIEYTGRVRQVAETAQYCALWFAFAVSLVIYSYVVATLRMPLWDARFERADLALGFNWGAGYDWIMSSNWLVRYVLEHAYNSMMVQVFASIGFFALIGRSDRNRELLWIAMLSIVISVTLSGPFPALGPFTTGGIPKWSAVLVTIRDGSATQFTLSHLQGIVAFPSCHALMALLLVYVHRPPMKTFVPAAIVNLLMLIATPFAGHHYLVDMIAGAAVLAISIPIVHAATRPRSHARLEAI